MKYVTCLAVVVAVVSMASVTLAEDAAATSELPAALSAVGFEATEVLSDEEAHTIRGTGSKSNGIPIFQLKQFQVVGEAAGTTTLLEGVFGQFAFEGQNGLAAQGTFGGLHGSIAVSEGNLYFDFKGKAFQETLQFAGAFQQVFTQTFGKP